MWIIDVYKLVCKSFILVIEYESFRSKYLKKFVASLINCLNMLNTYNHNLTVLPSNDVQCANNSRQDEIVLVRKNTFINSLRPFYYFIRAWALYQSPLS